ncbi:threonine-phosphate decarboxylase CobD [Ferrimonas lipolytica]|uniref:threonine-phosphate decarboxylase n=1 Tax=Ferrimonas lipolytica TaxID=2724191 RepID=A0A6H1UDL5_9GAMM|nr:threonine-phosphate decarboxylase CobD [Ferrimonas lipolytica]QIZ76306.1 threonine-phosphate decarboxylase [Ferrimonas lipolytica]
MSLIHHGGRLAPMIARYNIPREQWLDVSTGVSPWTYPHTAIAAAHWNRLPEEEDGLEQAARDYYQCQSLLAVAGSQAAIQTLPEVWRKQLELSGDWRAEQMRVGLPQVGYKEHQKAWQRAGWIINHYPPSLDNRFVAGVDALVVINPNNPTGQLYDAKTLLQWQQQLAKKGGLMVVDEAFADVDLSQSISHLCPQPGLVVLRSVGKFFGLAGIRAGFVLAPSQLLSACAYELGPWTIAGPARQICMRALQDTPWQLTQRQRLAAATVRLQALLQPLLCHGASLAGTDLFQTLYSNKAVQWHEQLCADGVFTRLTDEQDGIRFGLVDDEQQWQRLAAAISKLT